MKLKKRYIAILVILALLIVIAVTHTLWLEAIAKFLIVRDEISQADVIVILGGGGPDRVWQGVDLYQSGYAKWMLATGMKQEMPGLVVTWPELARREAVSLGVPEDAFIVEDRPTSTYEDAIYVKEDMLNRGFKSAIIVSSPHHTRRARMIFRKVFKDHKDISLQFSPVENGKFQVKKWWTREEELIGVVNEYCKIVLYFFKYII
jgi:uncharacterized SAM-binding protein YcdF (DUF218 family)